MMLLSSPKRKNEGFLFFLIQFCNYSLKCVYETEVEKLMILTENQKNQNGGLSIDGMSSTGLVSPVSSTTPLGTGNNTGNNTPDMSSSPAIGPVTNIPSTATIGPVTNAPSTAPHMSEQI